jgi:amidase
MDRRAFLQLAVLGAVGCGARGPTVGARLEGVKMRRPHEEVEEASIAQLGARMASGELTAVALVRAYAERIDAIDRDGPALRSVLEVNPDAEGIARALDDERRAGRVRGPLHGIPLLVKDNLDTGDRTQTTAGSLALLGAPAPRDADVVKRLRDAGAVVLGKTNLSEWANIRSAHSTSGWSARGGLVKNPYALDRNASGSSSGTAAAVAASLAAAGIGTETDGSIVSPSSICGLVGVKPTVGLVSPRGIVPIAHSQDTAGPMARTVAGAAALLAVIAEKPVRIEGDARGARIGVVRGWPDVAPQVVASFEAAMAALRAAGAVLVDDVKLPHAGDLDVPELEVLLTELKADMASYLATRPGQPHRTLEDLVRFDVEHARAEMRWFGQDLFEKALTKGGLDGAAYLEALVTCRKLSRDEGIDPAIAAHRLDALVAPTGGPAWLSDLVNGDHVTGSASTPAAVAGYPSVTVPSGELDGLPLGVLFFGGPWSEGRLLGIAEGFERATRARRVPTYRARSTADRD